MSSTEHERLPDVDPGLIDRLTECSAEWGALGVLRTATLIWPDAFTALLAEHDAVVELAARGEAWIEGWRAARYTDAAWDEADPYREAGDMSESECTCIHYVVDYSDPDRYHSENVDRELTAGCPEHDAPGAGDGHG